MTNCRINMEIIDIVRSSKDLTEAMTNFLSAPSFSTKQNALELLLGQVCMNNLSANADAGAQ